MTKTGKTRAGRNNLKDNSNETSYEKLDCLFVLIFVLLLFLDQLTKHLVRTYLANPIDLKIFSIVYTTNTGIAFSMLQNFPLIPAFAAIIVILLIFVNRKKLLLNNLSTIGFSLIAAGATGNLIDRFAFSRVTDFIDFHFWPVFNIADSALTIGALLLVIYFWKK